MIPLRAGEQHAHEDAAFVAHRRRVVRHMATHVEYLRATSNNTVQMVPYGIIFDALGLGSVPRGHAEALQRRACTVAPPLQLRVERAVARGQGPLGHAMKPPPCFMTCRAQ